MGYLKRDRRIEKLLRDARPQPSAQLMHSLAPRRSSRRQFAFAGALTAGLAVALASVGGVSYAANAVNHAVKAAKSIVVVHHAKAPLSINAGGDQYRPGYGFGDPNHNHIGPPGLTGKGGEKRPPAQSTRTEKTVLVRTSVRLDEQAALYVSVIDKNGKQLLLNQEGSIVGGKVTGPQVKTIHYTVLVPRLIPIAVQIPKHLIKSGQPYRIHVIAVDPNGNKSTTDSLFVG